MRKESVKLGFFLTCFLAFSACASMPDPVLEFSISNELKRGVRLSELKNNIENHRIIIFDTEYKQNKTYSAFKFLEVLNYVYGEKVVNGPWNAISFTALDGYEAVSDAKNLLKGGGYLVFADQEFKNWQPIPGHGDTTPAPFYLVWAQKEKTSKNGYPWPWQISTISLISLAKQYPAAYPADKLEDKQIVAGYQTFMSRCISCHALDREGGKIGPDLNAPMNILRYRSEEMVKSFIRTPSEYRYSKMPDFVDLSEQEIDQLIEYLWYLNRRVKNKVTSLGLH